MLAYLNFGDVDYYGADVALEWIPNPQFSLFSNFSYVSDDFFDDVELGEDGTGRFVALNAPTNKFRAGFEYRDPSGPLPWAGTCWIKHSDGLIRAVRLNKTQQGHAPFSTATGSPTGRRPSLRPEGRSVRGP